MDRHVCQRKLFGFFEKNSCKLEQSVVSYSSWQRDGCQTGKYPGVAKFGIALEWGSRGRWFESSHSDQGSTCVRRRCSFFAELCEPAASWRRRRVPSAAAGRQTLRVGRPLVRIQSLGPTSEQSPLCSDVLFFLRQKRTPSARSLAPPLQIATASLGCNLVFPSGSRSYNDTWTTSEQALYRLLRHF